MCIGVNTDNVCVCVCVCKEHFFSESNGQTGYIQDRLKRVRRSLTAEEKQRPRKSTRELAAAGEQFAGKRHTLLCLYMYRPFVEFAKILLKVSVFYCSVNIMAARKSCFTDRISTGGYAIASIRPSVCFNSFF